MHASPHVLLVTADHWPASLLGVAGHPAIATPTLDQLARMGTRFPRAYTECPVCIPARRTLLSGTSPRTHGDRTFQVYREFPDVPSIADCFRQAGYQSVAVGKLHVYPPRARVGFDEVILSEEGRPQLGGTDDYELYLGEQGYVGQQFLHGMSNNDYVSRPWHLPEACHVTNWTARQMSRMIQRRDPTRPGFWFLSFTHPHPPLVPLASYLQLYQSESRTPPSPYLGAWKRDPDQMPMAMNRGLIDSDHYDARLIRDARAAFYALCTHIDHQLRIVLGTLREEGLLDQTIILFAADHGDMLGNHQLWAKRLFYEDSACVPMILVGPAGEQRVQRGHVDSRLAALQDIMPTLLDLAGIAPPDSVDGMSLVSPNRRDFLYGEYGEGNEATRMIHDGRYKLIYYAAGNRLQIFDLQQDPRECNDLAGHASIAPVRERLVERLVAQLYGSDQSWLDGDQLRGLPPLKGAIPRDRTLALQRGSHWPEPPSQRTPKP